MATRPRGSWWRSRLRLGGNSRGQRRLHAQGGRRHQAPTATCHHSRPCHPDEGRIYTDIGAHGRRSAHSVTQAANAMSVRSLVPLTDMRPRNCQGRARASGSEPPWRGTPCPRAPSSHRFQGLAGTESRSMACPRQRKQPRCSWRLGAPLARGASQHDRNVDGR